GRFTVKDQALVGLPESPAPAVVRFGIRAYGERLVFTEPVFVRATDPVKGEQYRRFEVVPPVTASPDERVYLFPGSGTRAGPREVRVTVRGARAGLAGSLRLKVRQGWTSPPPSVPC